MLQCQKWKSFSCAGNIATPKRNKLGKQKLEDLVILKENKKHILTLKSEYKNFKQVENIIFDIDILENGPIEEEDQTDHELLCSDISSNNDSDFDIDECNDDDEIDI